MSEHRLHKLMNPESIAFVGASNKMSTMGTVHLNTLLHDGFQGPIYPIHPKLDSVLGLKAYPDFASLPETPDLVVMLVNRDHLLPLVEAAGQKGIRNAVIISGGFAEAGDHGPALQKRLLELTTKYDIRVVGPNCIGVVNPHAKMNVTYFPYTAAPGAVGLLSHSGTYLSHMYSYLGRRGIGLAEGMSLGNELNTGLVDGVEYLSGRPEAKAIAMYVESIRDPRAFIEVCNRASKEKPLVAMTVGGSEAGARAASSHTASLTGKTGVLAGCLDQAGVVRAQGMQELFDFAHALSILPPMKGKNVAVLTNSGGPGASAADCLERIGLACPVLSQQTQEKLRAIQPHTGNPTNPVDFTYTTDISAFYIDAPRILMEDPEVDGLLVYGLFGVDFWEKLEQASEGRITFDNLDGMRQLTKFFFDSLAGLPGKYGKPLMTINIDGFSDEGTKMLRDRNIPVMPSPERAVACLWALHRYHCIRNR